MQNGKHPTKQVFDDKKLQKDVKAAAESFKEAAVALREAPHPQKRKRGGFGKLLVIGIVGAAVALAVSEDLRKKVLDALFGAEEEFEYTSTTSPAPAPETSLHVAPARHLAGSGRAPTGRPSSSYSPAMKSRTSTSAPGRGSVSLP